MLQRKFHTRAAPRRGVSLIEVLMSIFILSVGLLGMASLIPVGGYQVAEAIKSDRSAAVGRAAFNEVRMRGLLDPRAWRNGNDVDTRRPFVIDPLGADQNGGLNALFRNSNQLVELLWPDANDVDRQRLARHIFKSHDDLIFVPHEKPDNPPRQILGNSGKRPSGDRYSWLVTVVPVGSEASGQSTQGELHRVSVAVFFSRQPNDPTATVPVVNARVMPDTEQATLPIDTRELTGASSEDLKSLKDNRWILVSSSTGMFRWYRVVSRRGPRITVDGPEITVGRSGLRVVLFKDVVGVYEQSLKLGGPSLWTD